MVGSFVIACDSHIRPHTLTTLSHLEVAGSVSGSTITPSVGVTVSANAKLTDLVIHNFDVGLMVSANTAESMFRNANTNWYERIRVYDTRHAQVLVRGTDANAATFLGINATAPGCTDPNTFSMLLGECGGIVDHSFLGNTWIGSHVAGTEEYRAMIFDNANAASAVIGPYTEGGQGKSWAGPLTTVVSGQNGVWEGPGLVVMGPRMNNIRVFNDLDPSNRVQLEMGRNTGPGNYMTLRSLDTVGGAWPLRLVQDGDDIMMSVGNYGPTFCGLASLGPNGASLEVLICE